MTSIYLSGGIDPVRKLFIVLGGCGATSCGPGDGVFVADISDPTTTTQQNWTAATMADTTCAEFLSGGVNAISSANPGFTYDSVANDFVGWPNQKNSVYILTPETANKRLTCQKQTFDNGPSNSAHSSNKANTSNGTFGRFRYFPGLDVFVVVNDWDIPASILRLHNSTTRDFTLAAAPSSASAAAGGSTTYTVSVGAADGFSGTVSLSATGVPTLATGTFNPAAMAGGGSSTLTVATTTRTALGSPTLTITGTSGSLTHTATVTLNLARTPSFTLLATPRSATVALGGSTTSTVSVGAVNGFSGKVNLSVSGLPAGATGTFNPTAVGAGASSTLTIATAANTPAETSTLTITGTSGSLTYKITVPLSVTP